MALIVKDNAPAGTAPAPAPPETPRRPFVASPQQESFLSQLDVATSHILLEARAGSGKSTTCREGAKRLHARRLRSIYCCFNAHIAREFQADLPPSCKAATMHSLGLSLVRQLLGDVQVDEDKLDRIAEKYFPERWQRPERYATAKLVGLCKNLLLTGRDDAELKQLAADFDVELPAGTAGEVLAVVPEVLDLCLQQTAIVDFDDMIWLPVMLGLEAIRSPDVLFVDEAQDLNACQHELVSALCPAGRVVVVGDRHQAIYGFRGADHASIPNLESRLSVTTRRLATFPLTVTRRCPVRHVELARRIVPDLDHLPEAIAGEVEEIKPEAYLDAVRAGDMMLCRTSAPLVSACYRLIRGGTKATVRGRDIGKGLLALIARMRCREVRDLIRRIGDFRAAEADKIAGLRNPGPALQALNDKCDCLLALTEAATSVEEVRRRAESMFSDLSEDNAVILSSIHRAKGLERDHIVVLRPDLLPGPWADRPEDVQQERNLVYVCVTRSRRRLTFCGPIPQILQNGRP